MWIEMNSYWVMGRDGDYRDVQLNIVVIVWIEMNSYWVRGEMETTEMYS